MIDFNVNEYYQESANKLVVLPEGKYQLRILECEIKPTKKTLDGLDKSRFLEIKFDVISGASSNALLFDRMNIYHSSDDASRIGREQLAKLCNAVNKMGIRSINELKGCRLVAMVAVKDDLKYGKSNTIKWYETFSDVKEPIEVEPIENELNDELPF